MQLTASRTRFTSAEGYRITVDAMRSIPLVGAARRELGEAFFERLMLAVTEVNGCALCSYGHAKAALEAGLSSDEIAELLGGDHSGIPADEAPAIVFAQHYAESRGRPSRVARQRLIDEYGDRRARHIRATIRTIMWGNAYGIPASALLSRLRGHPHEGSTLRYEVGMLSGIVPTVIAAAPRAAVMSSASRRARRRAPMRHRRRLGSARRPRAAASPPPATPARS